MNAFADILETIAHAPIEKRAMTNHGVLNEAYAYAKPSSFSRGMRIDIGGVDDPADLRHGFDRRERRERAHRRLSARSCGAPSTTSPACWRAKAAPGTTSCARAATCATSIATTMCSTQERTAFFKEQGLDPLPASTGIQAHLCRPELLIEIEAIAMFRTDKACCSKE